jgi:hypothetical protein
VRQRRAPTSCLTGAFASYVSLLLARTVFSVHNPLGGLARLSNSRYDRERDTPLLLIRIVLSAQLLGFGPVRPRVSLLHLDAHVSDTNFLLFLPLCRPFQRSHSHSLARSLARTRTHTRAGTRSLGVDGDRPERPGARLLFRPRRTHVCGTRRLRRRFGRLYFRRGRHGLMAEAGSLGKGSLREKATASGGPAGGVGSPLSILTSLTWGHRVHRRSRGAEAAAPWCG